MFPDRTAIVHGDRRYTYAQFADEAQRLARVLRSRIQPGDRVAFLAPNVPELLIAHFAVPLAGGVLIALNSRLAGPELSTSSGTPRRRCCSSTRSSWGRSPVSRPACRR